MFTQSRDSLQAEIYDIRGAGRPAYYGPRVQAAFEKAAWLRAEMEMRRLCSRIEVRRSQHVVGRRRRLGMLVTNETLYRVETRYR